MLSLSLSPRRKLLFAIAKKKNETLQKKKRLSTNEWMIFVVSKIKLLILVYLSLSVHQRWRATVIVFCDVIFFVKFHAKNQKQKGNSCSQTRRRRSKYFVNRYHTCRCFVWFQEPLRWYFFFIVNLFLIFFGTSFFFIKRKTRVIHFFFCHKFFVFPKINCFEVYNFVFVFFLFFYFSFISLVSNSLTFSTEVRCSSICMTIVLYQIFYYIVCNKLQKKNKKIDVTRKKKRGQIILYFLFQKR